MSEGVSYPTHWFEMLAGLGVSVTLDAGRNYAVALLLLTLVLPSQVHRHSKEKT